MLTHIHISDYTIIERLELELASGMTALTGETGAGKSILVDALGFVLGDRADTGAIRAGAAACDVSATFDIAGNAHAHELLCDQDLDEGDELLVRRTLNAEGRSRGYVNGRPVAIGMLQQLGAALVDIHGQHEHQSLLRRDAQRMLLDEFAGHAPQLAELAGEYKQWKTLQREFDDITRAARERGERLDLLRFQVKELDTLTPREDELAALEDEHKRLAHAGRLLGGGEAALNVIYENDEAAVLGLLGHALHELQALRGYDARLEPAIKLLEDAGIHLREAVAELRHYCGGLEVDPHQLQEVEQRLASLHDAARKYRVSVAELPALHAQLKDELEKLDGGEERMEKLQRELAAARDEYRRRANALGASRREAARGLGDHVTAHMQELGMPGGRFEITVAPRAEDDATPSGMDQIEFMVSANPGQPLRPLGKVASGGELSRISLAIQVVTAQGTGVPTLVYDEVDVGIGGRVAEIVGQRLRALGERRQVLCVTHLPQVAAQAHHHLQVSKSATDGKTRTGIRVLHADDRHEEIARMLGGVEITEQTRAHAKEMVERAQGAEKAKPKERKGRLG